MTFDAKNVANAVCTSTPVNHRLATQSRHLVSSSIAKGEADLTSACSLPHRERLWLRRNPNPARCVFEDSVCF
jgi:hypothetical protein